MARRSCCEYTKQCKIVIMKREIYIFGTGGFSKEVYSLIYDINNRTETYKFGGFVDVNPSETEMKIGKLSFPVLAESEFMETSHAKDCVFALGMGNPKILNKIRTSYIERFEFPNLIHPNFCGHLDAISLGRGNVITAGCIFTIDIVIGDLNLFNLHTTLGHDSLIHNCNVFNPGVNLSGGINIGSRNLFGTNCSVLQYIQVGNDNMIGAGAMVNKNVENGKVAVGVPAKVIKEIY